MMFRSCLKCSNEFRTFNSTIKKGGGKFCSHRCARLYHLKFGKENAWWKGGKFVDKFGYLQVFSPEHPFAQKKYVPDHRLVMEKYLGRYLVSEELIHHKNHNRQDNRVENLLLVTRSEHTTIHKPVDFRWAERRIAQ